MSYVSGFAPHYDDIEAFVMQIEGRKRWKLYKPRSAADILPRESSHNFSQQEIGKPILEEVFFFKNMYMINIVITLYPSL